jgi:hypothetical protein
MKLPPKDIESLKKYYKMISMMQMEDPDNVYKEEPEEMTSTD